MERSTYLRLLQRWKWMLLLAALVAGLVGFLAATQIAPTYEAEARLLVGPANASVDTVRAAEALSLTYAELATVEPAIRAVVDELGLDIESSVLADAITVNAISTTRILSIRVIHTDPELTAAVANGLANEMEDRSADNLGRPEGRLTVVDPAVVPVEPIGPNIPLIALLAGIAGLLVAGLLAAAVEYFSNTVNASSDLAEMTGGTVLGEVNVNHGYRSTPVQPLVVEARPESRTALGYRLLASRMPLGRSDGEPLRSILVVGAQAGEQVGEFAANLAAVLARTGRSVTLVDADDLEAYVTNMFVPDRRAGLSELLALAPEAIADGEALETLRVKRAPSIDLIPAGTSESRTVREDMVAALLDALTARSDLVVVSGAPIHRSAQALLWARHTDGVLLVARADTTRVENVRYAVESLRLIEAPLLGSVLLVRQQGGTDRWYRRSAPVPEPVAPASPIQGFGGQPERLRPPPGPLSPLSPSAGQQAPIS
ncbi:MAG TPA: hypothetical protein VI277_06050, partial [Candidatus Limnocylindria bacterium]